MLDYETKLKFRVGRSLLRKRHIRKPCAIKNVGHNLPKAESRNTKRNAATIPSPNILFSAKRIVLLKASFEYSRISLINTTRAGVHGRYRASVMGLVWWKRKFAICQKIETSTKSNVVFAEIDKSTFNKKPRKKLAKDGRLKTFGVVDKTRCLIITACCLSIALAHSIYTPTA